MKSRNNLSFNGLQFAVVENIEDIESPVYDLYQQPIAMFFGPDAAAYSYQYCSQLNQNEKET